MEKEFRNTFIGISVLYVLFGLGMVIWPENAKRVVCYAAGILCIAYAAFRLIMSWRAAQFVFFGPGVVWSVVLLLLGFLMLIKSNAVSAMFTALIGLSITVDSLVKLQMAWQLKKYNIPRWKGDFIGAAALLVIGIFLLFDPFSGAKLMTTVVGCILILNAGFNLWLLFDFERSIMDFKDHSEHTIEL